MDHLRIICLALAVFCLACAAPSATADEAAKASPAAASEAKRFVTRHEGRFNGVKIAYSAEAGETIIRDDTGAPIAAFFSIAYLADNPKGTGPRPVTFLFNGGPGSASLWLHMGAFGPKRVALPSEPDDDGAPPYPVVDNPDTILDISDLVFIDPVGTGWSIPLGEKKAEDFYGVTEDAESIARFIHQWLKDRGRWNTPIYIAGESYGTLRTGALLKALADRRHMIGVNGAILISAVLDYQMSRFPDGNIMSYVSFLPSYAATAWYHDRLPEKPADLKAFLDEVRTFARTDYATALIAGSRLPAEERTRIIDKLHAYTGLSRDWLDGANMRIHVFRYFKELRRDDKLVVGRLDSRYTGVETDSVGENFATDPFASATGDAYAATIRAWFHDGLGIRMERPYFPSSLDAGRKWNWIEGERAPNGGRFINVVPYIAETMQRNKDFRLLVTQGWFDFATPFFGAENALAEPGVPADRVRFTYYPAGHMMYLHDASRAAFLKDVHDFISAGGK
ncbi:MAG: peptidase S10 [Rhodothalassiaceae bacterium]